MLYARGEDERMHTMRAWLALLLPVASIGCGSASPHGQWADQCGGTADAKARLIRLVEPRASLRVHEALEVPDGILLIYAADIASRPGSFASATVSLEGVGQAPLVALRAEREAIASFLGEASPAPATISAERPPYCADTDAIGGVACTAVIPVLPLSVPLFFWRRGGSERVPVSEADWERTAPRTTQALRGLSARTRFNASVGGSFLAAGAALVPRGTRVRSLDAELTLYNRCGTGDQKLTFRFNLESDGPLSASRFAERFSRESESSPLSQPTFLPAASEVPNLEPSEDVSGQECWCEPDSCSCRRTPSRYQRSTTASLGEDTVCGTVSPDGWTTCFALHCGERRNGCFCVTRSVPLPEPAPACPPQPHGTVCCAHPESFSCRCQLRTECSENEVPVPSCSVAAMRTIAAQPL